MKPQDEFVHEYPNDPDHTWKENWYFNFIDRKHNAWGINHISLVRNKGKGRFTAAHVIDGQVKLYSQVIPIDASLKELTDDRLTFRFPEPTKKFQVEFKGEEYHLLLDYEGRFPVFDYGEGLQRKSSQKAMSIEHYEQACTATGVLTLGQEKRNISCLGHRDHSWGYRDESKITGWNWVAAQFPHLTLNLSIVRVGEKSRGGGFISEAKGNCRIRKVEVDSELDPKSGEPIAARFTAEDEAGRSWLIASHAFSVLRLPVVDKKGGALVYENFAAFELLNEGVVGEGIDEYLVNPEMAGVK